MPRATTLVLALAVVVAILLMAWPFIKPHALLQGPTDADISALAKDAHVIVGDVPLVLPTISLPDRVGGRILFA